MRCPTLLLAHARRPIVSGGGTNPYLPGDTVLIDTRSGQTNDLQSIAGSTALDTALTIGGMQTVASGASTVSRFLHNSDLGVNCFGHDWVGFATMTLGQNITASGSPQTVNVTYNSGQPSVGKIVGIGWGTANQEAVTLTGTGTGTITGVFTKNHSSGDKVAIGQDMNNRIGVGFSGTLPRHLFIQWKQYMGKTASDSSGLGSTGSYLLYNGYITASGQNFDPTQSSSNAGRKLILALRQIWDSGALDRLNTLWPGTNGSSNGLALDSDGHYTSGAGGSIYSPNYLSVGSGSYDPSGGVGHIVTHTLELMPESSLLAGDGYMKLTSAISGGATVTQQSPNCCTGPEAMASLQILPTMNSPEQPQTEYTWDYVIWEHPWSGAKPPQQASAIPTYVSSASTTMTFTIPVPSSAPDTVRFYAGGSGPTSSTVYGVGGTSGGAQIGSDISLAPGDAGTNKTVTVTGLTPSTTYTGICCAFGLSGRFGVQSGGLASESTTA